MRSDPMLSDPMFGPIGVIAWSGLALAFLLLGVVLRLIAARPLATRKDPRSETIAVSMIAVLMILAYLLLVWSGRVEGVIRSGILSGCSLVSTFAALLVEMLILDSPIGRGRHFGPGWEVWLDPWTNERHERVVRPGQEARLGLFRFFVPAKRLLEHWLDDEGEKVRLYLEVAPAERLGAGRFVRRVQSFERALDDLITARYLFGRIQNETGLKVSFRQPLEQEVSAIAGQLSLQVLWQLTEKKPVKAVPAFVLGRPSF